MPPATDPLNFAGLVLPFQRRHVLVYGPEAEAIGEPLFGPPVHIRPGYRLIARPDYLLPTAAIDDRGQRFEGQAAYAWIETHGDAFPRADAIGTLASGEPENVFIKELDLAELAVFATASPGTGRPVRLSLAIEALAVPDGDALTPIPSPPDLQLFERALPCYRLAPGAFGAAGAAILSQLLSTGRRDWRVTFDQLDDLLQL
jgi:hypothetical protein